MHGWSRIELAPLLKRRVFSSTQPAETRERVSEALKEHRLTWKGDRVDAELNRARFGALSVCTLRYGAEVHIEPDRLQDFMLVQVPLRGRARIECGTDCVDAHPDCAAVIAPNRALKLHWEAGCEQLLLKIPRGKLEAIGHRIFGDAAARPLDFSPALRLDTPVGAAWRSMMTSLI
ncbi:cupin domain-containing protein, partial [Achromobacter xylosoxidans]